MKRKMPMVLSLFLAFLRIGAFTFGGGYAMIALIRAEFVERRGWLQEDEFLDMVAIAESTPGPIAINAATYIGFRMGGFPGALCATIGVCVPSFVIIYVISLFFDAFLALSWVAWAFKGIQACVAYLILSAGVRMVVGMKKTPLAVVLLCATIAAMTACTLFAVSFSTIFYILIGAAVGVAVYFAARIRERKGVRK